MSLPMTVLILPALLVSSSCEGLTEHSTEEEDLPERTAVFIDGLKRFLRKNNDDYAELGAGAGVAEGRGRDTPRHRRAGHNDIDGGDKDSARQLGRHGDASDADSPGNRRHEDRTQTKKKRFKNTIDKEERMQQFVKKNEGLIRDFLSSKIVHSITPRTSSLTSLSSSNPPLPPDVTAPSSLFSPDNNGPSRHFSSSVYIQLSSPSGRLSPSALLATPPSFSSGREGRDRGPPAVRQLVTPGARLHRVDVPRPDQLDMAPASGAKIHNLRIKGRLCQRSVLFPEGPKYDSNGKAYIRSHDESIAHRDFADTRRPKYVLPRCCNCCKKSVLGCE